MTFKQYERSVRKLDGDTERVIFAIDKIKNRSNDYASWQEMINNDRIEDILSMKPSKFYKA